jgi:hypothetical protein
MSAGCIGTTATVPPASLWRRDALAGEVGRCANPRLRADDEEGAPTRRAGDDAQRGTAALHEAVQGRARADVGDVDFTGQQRFDQLGAGAEGRDVQRVWGECRAQTAIGHGDQRRRVGQVGQMRHGHRDGPVARGCR